MQSYPFTSQVVYDEDGRITGYDRAVDSDFLRKFYKKDRSNGIVMLDDSSAFLVSANTGTMTVSVNAGLCFIQGAYAIESDDRTLQLEASESNLDRIDTVVIRLNDDTSVRAVDLYVIKGTPSANPTQPVLTRDTSIYELGIANIYIPSKSTQVKNERITDTRLNTNRCGVSLLNQSIDTTNLYNQIQSDLSDFKLNEETSFNSWRTSFEETMETYQEGQEDDFESWFETVQGQLGEDEAGKLWNAINKITYMYVENETLFLPNTAGSVTDDTLILYGQSNEEVENNG